MNNRTLLSNIANSVAAHAGRKAARDLVRKLLKCEPDRWTEFTEHSELHWNINQRGSMRAHFEAVQQNGKIGIIVAGMDCDCVKYHYEHVEPVPVSMMVWQRGEQKRCDYAEGPESVHYVSPNEVQHGAYWSRDLVMEAYEDGHSHVVYA